MPTLRPPLLNGITRTCRGLAAAALIGLAAAFAAPADAAGDGIVSASEAQQRANRGELTIVDIRRPDEWRQTGLPEGAAQATVNFSRGASGFLARIRELTAGDKAAPIALICASGVRSRHAALLLRGRGYRNVLDISEGMYGNASGPGWLERQLPVEFCAAC